ncbi:acid-sensing ion channel 5-like [Haliotis cracherodii]|uniref:acid-sensing ion channel 5-like n=1 Tax=Haliotis cracherodii TaxID=6455 RepID=UPI0039ED9740
MMSQNDEMKRLQCLQMEDKAHVLQEDDPLDAGEPDKKGVKNLLIYYARHSTMHGIPSIVGSRLYRGRSIFWCIVVMVMAILLVTVIYCQMSDFYRYPTVTSVNVRYVDEEDFPAVTICDLNVFNKEFMDKMDKHTQMAMPYLTEISGIFHLVGKILLDKILQNEGMPPSNKTADDIVDALLGDVEKMVVESGLKCAWGDYYWEDCGDALTTRITEMGLCFTINTRNLTRRSNGHKMNAVSNSLRGLSALVTTVRSDIPYRLYQFEGFKVVLHDHDEDPLPQSRGFVVGANCSSEVEITKTVRIGLEPPFKAFGGSTCVDTNSDTFVNPLRRFDYYSKEACEKECFFDYVIKVCGCRHFLHPGNETLCSMDRLAVCYRAAEAKYYRGNGDRDVEKAPCVCPLPCTETHYAAAATCTKFRATDFFESIVHDLGADVVTLHFFFPDPVVTTIEQVPIYTLQGLLGSIGGQVGLFMGFSLITVAEMFELIFLLCTRGRHLREERRDPMQHTYGARHAF